MTFPRRILATSLAASISFAGLVQTAHASGTPLVSTEQVAASQGVRTAAEHRAHVLATLERADVSAALVERGVSLEQARERVAALTDAEAAQMAAEIDRAPAGADVLGVIVFLFVLLLVTDILGFTKVFPFTRTIR